MRNKYTKALLIITIAAVAASSVGCASGDTTNNSSKVETADADNITDTIRMITWDNAGTVEALEKINDMFTQETGITVELSRISSTDYEDFLKENVSSGKADIFCYTTDSKAFAQPMVDWAPSDLLTWEAIISEGYALDISGYDFINNWSTGAKACSYKDGIYGIATGMTIMNGLFYNKKLFEEHGWHEPRTWDEFTDLCDGMLEENIAPITVGGADVWPVQMITNAIVDTVFESNSEEFIEGLWKGERKFTDDDSMEIYRREKQILKYMDKDFLDVAYADAPARFTEGKAAMFYSGSWDAASIEAADPEFEYDYFAIPGDHKHNFTGKYDLTFGINAKTEHTEEAVKWLEFFSRPDIYTIYIDSNGFVPTMSWISTSNDFLMLIDDRLSDAGRTFECYNRVPSNMAADSCGTFDLINYSIAGGRFDTPEEFAGAAQEEWDRVLSEIFVK